MPTVTITGTNCVLGFEFVKQYAADGTIYSSIKIARKTIGKMIFSRSLARSTSSYSPDHFRL